MSGVRRGFNLCMSARYIRGYIGDNNSKRGWLRDCTLTWEENIVMINKNTGRYPQESYAAVVHVIQLEWVFLQRITWDMGYTFAGVEKMTQETFLPPLFFRYKNPLTHRRSSKYNSGQESRIGTPESSDISKIKVPKFPESKRGDDLGSDGRRSVLQRGPPSGAQGGKA